MGQIYSVTYGTISKGMVALMTTDDKRKVRSEVVSLKTTNPDLGIIEVGLANGDLFYGYADRKIVVECP